jgi:acyl carrier protein phosphodiesterase
VNFLAHIFLAQHSDRAMVGALLGDFVKGDDGDRYPPEIAREIRLHRQIDRYTDSHPVVRAGLALFPEGRRRFAGIILDIFYDHRLSRRWDVYSVLDREEFIARFYRALDAHMDLLPGRLAEIAPYIIGQDWLGSYYDYAGVEATVRRVSKRLSRQGDRMRAGLEDLRMNRDALAEGFDRFFPDLIRFVEEQRASLESGAGQAQD